MYFDYIHLPLLPLTPTRPALTQLHIFIFITTHPQNPFCVAHIQIGVGPFPAAWMAFQKLWPGRKRPLLLQGPSVINSSSPRGGGCELLVLPCWAVDWLDVLQATTESVLSENSSLLVFRDSVLPCFFLISGSYHLSASHFMMFLVSWSEGCDIAVPFMVEHSTDTHYLHSDKWFFWVKFSSLHKEDSLMKSGHCTNLWI